MTKRIVSRTPVGNILKLPDGRYRIDTCDANGKRRRPAFSTLSEALAALGYQQMNDMGRHRLIGTQRFPTDKIRDKCPPPKANTFEKRRRAFISDGLGKNGALHACLILDYLDDIASMLETGTDPMLVARDIRMRATNLVDGI